MRQDVQLSYKYPILIVLAISLFCGVWLWKSPEWQMEEFDRAIQIGDAGVVNDHINYAAMQHSLVDQMRQRIAQAVSRGDISPIRATELSDKLEAFASSLLNAGLFTDGLERNKGKTAVDRPFDMTLNRTSITSFDMRDKDISMSFQLEGLTWRAVYMDMSKSDVMRRGPS